MPFITQCPHDACRKFMLLEDEAQGAVVNCLVCKHPIQLDPDGDEPTAAAAEEEEIVDLQAVTEPAGQPATPSQPAAQPPAFQVRNCPKCGTPLRIPRGQENQAVQCSECNFWGLV